MAIKIFEWFGRVAIISLVVLGALAYFQVGGWLFLLAFVVTMFGSFLYIWHQGRLRWQGLAYPKSADLLLACSLPIGVMLLAGYIVSQNFSLVAAAYR